MKKYFIYKALIRMTSHNKIDNRSSNTKITYGSFYFFTVFSEIDGWIDILF